MTGGDHDHHSICAVAQSVKCYASVNTHSLNLSSSFLSSISLTPHHIGIFLRILNQSSMMLEMFTLNNYWTRLFSFMVNNTLIFFFHRMQNTRFEISPNKNKSTIYLISFWLTQLLFLFRLS